MAITLKSITFDAKFLTASLIIGLLVFSIHSYENIENYNTAKNDLNKAMKECLTQQKLGGGEIEIFCDEKKFLSGMENYKEAEPGQIQWSRLPSFNNDITVLSHEKKLQFSIIKYYFILIMGYAFAIGIFWKFLLKRITEIVKAFKV